MSATTHALRIPLVLATIGLLPSPGNAEEIKYYTWTDEQGVTQIGDQPPVDREYETRSVNVDTPRVGNQAPSYGNTEHTESDDMRASRKSTAEPGPDSTGNRVGEPESGTGKAVILKRHLDKRELGNDAGVLNEVPRLPGTFNFGAGSS